MTCLRYVVKCQLVRARGITLAGSRNRADETFHAPDFGFMISRNFFHPPDEAWAAPLNNSDSDQIYEVSIKITRATVYKSRTAEITDEITFPFFADGK